MPGLERPDESDRERVRRGPDRARREPPRVHAVGHRVHGVRPGDVEAAHPGVDGVAHADDHVGGRAGGPRHRVRAGRVDQHPVPGLLQRERRVDLQHARHAPSRRPIAGVLSPERIALVDEADRRDRVQPAQDPPRPGRRRRRTASSRSRRGLVVGPGKPVHLHRGQGLARHPAGAGGHEMDLVPALDQLGEDRLDVDRRPLAAEDRHPGVGAHVDDPHQAPTPVGRRTVAVSDLAELPDVDPAVEVGLDVAPAGVCQSAAQVGIVHQPAQGVGERRHVTLGDQETGATVDDRLRDARDRRGHDRGAEGEALEDDRRQAVTVPVGADDAGSRQDRGPADPVARLELGERAVEGDLPRDTESVRACLADRLPRSRPPTRSRCTGRPRRTSSAIASSRWWKPFFSTSRPTADHDRWPAHRRLHREQVEVDARCRPGRRSSRCRRTAS